MTVMSGKGPRRKSNAGQALIEVLISVAMGVLMVVAAAGIIVAVLKGSSEAIRAQTGAALAKELLENVRVFSERNWHNLTALSPGSANHYYLTTSTSPFAAASGEETITVSSTVFTRYFYVEDVFRDGGGQITSTGGTNDPSTKRVTATYAWPPAASKTIFQYLFRSGNVIFNQTNWSGGPGQIGPVTAINNRFDTSIDIDYASSTGSLFLLLGSAGSGGPGGSPNIDALDHWAWNPYIGWIDFYSPGTVVVGSQKLSGYATSPLGDISLDCATTRIGNICPLGQSDSRYYRVVNNGAGDLEGWAWSDALGWISFCGGQGTLTCPGTIPYRVLISNGDFLNYAWNDVVGWISMNCASPGTSCPPDYKVKTSWVPTPLTGTLDSSVFDTGIAGGAQLNSIMWRGIKYPGTRVQFQLATSNNSAGPWTFTGPTSPSDYYIPIDPGVPLRLDYDTPHHQNVQYFRYRIELWSDATRQATPKVDDVVINWSP